MPSSVKLKDLREDHEWEDLPAARGDLGVLIDRSDGSRTSSIASSVKLGTPRKRRAGTKTVFVASPRKTPVATRTKPESYRRLTRPMVSEGELQEVLTQTVRSSAKYVHEVLVWFFFFLKRPLSIFLMLWAIAIILNSLSASIRTAFSPLCIIPGISRSSLCTRPQYFGPEDERGLHGARHADYPKMVEIQSKTFEQLLDDSVGSSGLALEIKKAEIATKDLVTLVRVSKLTSKDHLADALVELVDDARNTANGLQKLSSKVSGAVDNILAINDYALQSIEGAQADQGSIMKYIWPFHSNGPDKEELLMATFSQSLSVLSGSLERLIVSAQASLNELDKLELKLTNIYDIVAREDTTITTKKDELLAELWTRLGGNRGRIRSFNFNLLLLKDLGNYRMRALAHVVAALQALQTLNADMEELRERVAAPELMGGEIPVEVHARSIRSGIERLNEGRLKAKQREEEAVQRILGLDSD